jgi:HPt (histidine-containing phosphotransfer) domain-containing protein
MTTIQQLDLTLINGYLEALDLDVVKQMFTLYEQQSEIYIKDIEAAVREQNEKTWQEHCHKMKGSAASAGLSQVHAKLVAIEKSSESWTVKSQYVAELTSINVAGMQVFREWLVSQ